MGIESGRTGGWGSAGCKLVMRCRCHERERPRCCGLVFGLGRAGMAKWTRIFCAARRLAELPGPSETQRTMAGVEGISGEASRSIRRAWERDRESVDQKHVSVAAERAVA
jgi:hypothetical protein